MKKASKKNEHAILWRIVQFFWIVPLVAIFVCYHSGVPLACKLIHPLILLMGTVGIIMNLTLKSFKEALQVSRVNIILFMFAVASIIIFSIWFDQLYPFSITDRIYSKHMVKSSQIMLVAIIVILLTRKIIERIAKYVEKTSGRDTEPV